MELENLIVKCDAMAAEVRTFREHQASHIVERCDLTCVESTLRDASEQLAAIKEYLDDPTTDYVELWEQRKVELAQIKQAQSSWILTELYRLLLG